MGDANLKWVRCPHCKYPHLIKVRQDTILINSVCFCRKCKTENIINYPLTVHSVPDK